MEVKQRDDGKRGEFYIEIDGTLEAQMVYVWAGTDKIIIEHTEVSEKLKGKRAGNKMLDTAVAFVREKGIKIIPLCPFANAQLKKHAEYHDVIF